MRRVVTRLEQNREVGEEGRGGEGRGGGRDRMMIVVKRI
jgi:hypothetical protein